MPDRDDSIPRIAGRLFGHLPRRRRWQALIVLGLMLAGAVAEVVTLGAVLPFLALVANPERAMAYPPVAAIASILGLTDPGRLVLGAALVFMGAALVAAVIRITLARVSQAYVFKLGHDLGMGLYRTTLYRPYAFHLERNTSEVVTGITKVQGLIHGFLMPLMNGLTASIIASFIFVGLLLVDPVIAAASGLGFGGLYLLVSIVARGRLRKNSAVIARTLTQRTQAVQEGLGGIRDVLVGHAQEVYLAKFGRVDSSLRDSQAYNAFIGVAPRFVLEGLGMILIVALTLFMTRGEDGLVTALPVLGALALGAQRLLPLFQQIFNGWTQMTTNRSTVLDVLALLDYEIPEELRGGEVEPLPFVREITLRKVSFRYAPGAPLALKDISIGVPRGARVGFIGKTGSGKSTLMDLIMGLLEPTSGEILIDGVRLEPATRRAWQAQIAHVPQAIYLSDASLTENIAFAVPRKAIDPERVREAARRANIAEFIESLPDGYGTLVGERGVRLSGGQRQRIGIARALYRRSSLLIFDEATSALDNETERAVMEAIADLGRDITVLMIAHRLSTVQQCDRIYELHAGAVAASGDYDSVVRKRAPRRGKAAAKD